MRIRFWTNIFQADKENAIFRIYLEDIIPIIISGQQKCFLYVDYFLMQNHCPKGQTEILSSKNNLNMGNTFVVLTE